MFRDGDDRAIRRYRPGGVIFCGDNLQVIAFRRQRLREYIKSGVRLIGTDSARLRQYLVGAAFRRVDQRDRR